MCDRLRLRILIFWSLLNAENRLQSKKEEQQRSREDEKDRS